MSPRPNGKPPAMRNVVSPLAKTLKPVADAKPVVDKEDESIVGPGVLTSPLPCDVPKSRLTGGFDGVCVCRCFCCFGVD